MEYLNSVGYSDGHILIYQTMSYFKFKIYFFIYKNHFLGEKLFFLEFFLTLFFKLVLKFSDFINSDDCIGKITSKSIRLYPVLI